MESREVLGKTIASRNSDEVEENNLPPLDLNKIFENRAEPYYKSEKFIV
jgi:hypothetical protein